MVPGLPITMTHVTPPKMSFYNIIVLHLLKCPHKCFNKIVGGTFFYKAPVFRGMAGTDKHALCRVAHLLTPGEAEPSDRPELAEIFLQLRLKQQAGNVSDVDNAGGERLSLGGRKINVIIT